MLLLEVSGPAEAVGYYNTALVIRPGMALANNNLGSALTRTNRSGEAIGHYRQAIAPVPSGAPAPDCGVVQLGADGPARPL